jgi:hypothetical protein
VDVEWGRVNRGRVWHLVRPFAVGQEVFVPICASQPSLAVEVTRGQPPLGAIVCPRCQADVDDLYAAVTEAIRNQRVREPDRPAEQSREGLPGV